MNPVTLTLSQEEFQAVFRNLCHQPNEGDYILLDAVRERMHEFLPRVPGWGGR